MGKQPKGKATEVKDELEKTKQPTPKDIKGAENLAKRVSPLIEALFNAKKKKDK